MLVNTINTINTRNASALYYVTHNNSTHDKGRVIYLQKLMLTPSPSLPDPQWKKKYLPHGLSCSVPAQVFQTTDTNHTDGLDMLIFAAG